jgi:hypothetical protein
LHAVDNLQVLTVPQTRSTLGERPNGLLMCHLKVGEDDKDSWDTEQ